jgi:putative transposase
MPECCPLNDENRHSGLLVKHTELAFLTISRPLVACDKVHLSAQNHGMSCVTFYKWRAKYGSMDASLMARMKELEAENNRLKKMYADVQLQNDVIKEAMAKKW